MVSATCKHGIAVASLTSSFTNVGPDLGSNFPRLVEKPNILLVMGDGVSSSEASEIWHWLDQRYGLPAAKGEARIMSSTNLAAFNVPVLPNGSCGNISKSGIEALRNWVSDGGTLIAMRGSRRWEARNGLLDVKSKGKNGDNEITRKRPYEMTRRHGVGRVLAGSIFQIDADLSHPILFGYQRSQLPVFRRASSFTEPGDNPYATPGRYTASALLAGDIKEQQIEALFGSACVLTGCYGRRYVIGFADNATFKSFWWGTNKMLANAAFFGAELSWGHSPTATASKEWR